MSKRVDKVVSDITGDTTSLEAESGIEVPDFALSADLLGVVKESDNLAVVPLSWKGRLVATGQWVSIQNATTGNVNLGEKVYSKENVSVGLYDRLAPVVSGSKLNFALDTFVHFKAV